MVGLVIISHSRDLAVSLVSLVRQMAGNEVPIGVAAGVGNKNTEFGTDAVEIADTIRTVDEGDGVIVLMDLGSAVLSAETAIDLLPEELRRRVVLCPAPLVEGAIIAGVQASIGDDLDSVCRQASQALTEKQQKLLK